jgi:hypothetical protein
MSLRGFGFAFAFQFGFDFFDAFAFGLDLGFLVDLPRRFDVGDELRQPVAQFTQLIQPVVIELTRAGTSQRELTPLDRRIVNSRGPVNVTSSSDARDQT